MTSRRQAERALELHADELSVYPNVVGLGTSLTGREDRPPSERDHALAVYVTEKQTAEQLGRDGLLPGYVEIPGRGVTVKVAVEVIEIGDVETEHTEDRDTGESQGSPFAPE